MFPSCPEIFMINFHLSRKPQGLKARNHQHCTGEIRLKKLGFPKQANTSLNVIWMQMCFILSFRFYWQCWKQEHVKTQTPNFPPLSVIWCSCGKAEVSDFIHSADIHSYQVISVHSDEGSCTKQNKKTCCFNKSSNWCRSALIKMILTRSSL